MTTMTSDRGDNPWDWRDVLGQRESPYVDPAPADYEFWSKAARWTVEEATALSFGVEPQWVEWQNVKEWHYPCGEDYKKRLILGRRAQQAGDLPEPVFAPMSYTAWAKSVGIPFRAELERMLPQPKPMESAGKPAKPSSIPNQPSDDEGRIFCSWSMVWLAPFATSNRRGVAAEQYPKFTRVVCALALP